MVNYSRGASMITRYAARNRQNDPQRNNPNPNPHDFRNHRLLLVLRDSEIPSNHTQSPGFKDRAIYGRHPNGFVRRILSTLADARFQKPLASISFPVPRRKSVAFSKTLAHSARRASAGAMMVSISWHHRACAGSSMPRRLPEQPRDAR
jgi:hypothetical protein